MTKRFLFLIQIIEQEKTDEFMSFFNGLLPKILVTTSRRATAPVYEFANEFCTIFPNAQFIKRGSQFDVKKIVEIAIDRQYTDLIIINHDKKTPSNLYINQIKSHLFICQKALQLLLNYLQSN